MNDYQKKKLCELAEVGNLDIPDEYKIFHKARETINKAGLNCETKDRFAIELLKTQVVLNDNWKDGYQLFEHRDHGSEIKALEACLLEIIGEDG